MDKRSFDDVTSFIVRRHQINLCLSLLTIYGPSSSSSTSSSASSQRKSASQRPANGASRYISQASERKGLPLFFYYCFLICSTWHEANATLFDLLKDWNMFKPSESLRGTSALLLQRYRKPGQLSKWRQLFLVFHTRGHKCLQRLRRLSHHTVNHRRSPSQPPALHRPLWDHCGPFISQQRHVKLLLGLWCLRFDCELWAKEWNLMAVWRCAPFIEVYMLDRLSGAGNKS